MSTKLSLLSRAATVAGILALALPAVAAEATKPVVPTATTPSVAAPASTAMSSKPISGDAKTTSKKIVHAKKRHVINPVHAVAASTKPSVAPVVKPVSPAAPVAADAAKTGTPAK
jgi:hypothetical protein